MSGVPAMAGETLVPLPAVIGDIGGTNARFAIVARDGTVGPAADFPAAGFADFEAALQTVMAAAPEPPRSAVLALAAVIAGEDVPLTNSPWVVSPARLIAHTTLEQVVLLNDFEALSLSLPSFGADDLEAIGPDNRRASGVRVVLGPGTGLGAALLVDVDGRHVPVGGEGGHLDIGPRTDRDFEIWPHIERIGGRVSGEQILCGSGIVRLYRAVRASRGLPPLFTAPSEVTAAAAARSDADAVETLELFSAYFGRYAGDLALLVMPHGGVYLGGGITGRIAGFLKEGGFRENFIDKAPHRAVMDGFATMIITRRNPALAGLAAFLREPAKFAVDLTGKHWGG